MADSREQDADNHVGEQLRRYRGKTSLRDFGKRFGLSHTTMSQHENGIRPVSAGRLLIIAEELNVPVASFFPKQNALPDERANACDSVQ